MNQSNISQPKKNTIFVVDNDLAICDRINTLYSSSSCSIFNFLSIDDFLEFSFLKQTNIQAGCLIVGAGISGVSTINLLRELKCLKIDIPTIVLGSQHDFPEVVKVMRAGATDFLGKPFTDHRLKSSIKRALS